MRRIRNASVAVVDGDSINCKLVGAICHYGGWDVAGYAHNAPDGLALVTRTRPDCLITDYKFACEETGLHLIANAKRLLPRIFTVMLTGWDINEVAANVTTHQPDRMLRKPMPSFLMAELMEGIYPRAAILSVPA